MSKKLYLLFAVAALAASCEIEFDLDNVSSPALYVQYIASADSLNGMIVSYAEPVFNKLSKDKYAFNASDVTLEINGRQIAVSEDTEASSWNGHKLIVNGHGNPGDEVRVTVKGHGIPDAVAITRIPERPDVRSITMEKVTRDSSDAYQVAVKLDHPVRDGEYYGIKASRRFTNITISGKGTPDAPESLQTDTTEYVSHFLPGQIATTADLNSLDLDTYANIVYEDGFVSAGGYNGEVMALLSSRQFTGDTYYFYANALDSFSSSDFFLGTIDYTSDVPDYPDEDWEQDIDPDLDPDDEYIDPDAPDFWVVVSDAEEFRFEVFRLSEEFYNYAKAQYLGNFNMLSNFGVTPPNFTYTNVDGGLGIVAGLSGTSSFWMDAPR